ncbi:hypothetical protein WG68_07555 [Arsukibacterium ikkense]|uniref:DoxX family protein n=1 Tax=Arsukibacterium ikkense TaxID=336831 RepID=A0A0M2V9L8_9GAMM|nr:hypothetical protein [Arsukibacterium ikkense]KKO45873.1 hypothetical protein WG68_07555 [Arsukibacterium ikkense]
MQTAFTSDYNLLHQRSLSVPVWLKFLGVCLLGVHFLFLLYITGFLYQQQLPAFVTIAAENTTMAFGMIWLFFIATAASFYGLITGRYWGLLACFILGYLGLADAGYSLVNKGKIDLGLLIFPLFIYQLYKVKAKWAQP